MHVETFRAAARAGGSGEFAETKFRPHSMWIPPARATCLRKSRVGHGLSFGSRDASQSNRSRPVAPTGVDASKLYQEIFPMNSRVLFPRIGVAALLCTAAAFS